MGTTLLKGLAGTDTKGAAEREKEWRVACAWCLGEVWSVFGNQVRAERWRIQAAADDRAQVMSLFVDVVMTTTKVYRTTSLVSRSLQVGRRDP